MISIKRCPKWIRVSISPNRYLLPFSFSQKKFRKKMNFIPEGPSSPARRSRKENKLGLDRRLVVKEWSLHPTCRGSMLSIVTSQRNCQESNSGLTLLPIQKQENNRSFNFSEKRKSTSQPTTFEDSNDKKQQKMKEDSSTYCFCLYCP